MHYHTQNVVIFYAHITQAKLVTLIQKQHCRINLSCVSVIKRGLEQFVLPERFVLCLVILCNKSVLIDSCVILFDAFFIIVWFNINEYQNSITSIPPEFIHTTDERNFLLLFISLINHFEWKLHFAGMKVYHSSHFYPIQ